MIRVIHTKALGLTQPFLRPSPRVLNFPPTVAQASSLSAIHRGLRRSDKVQYGESRSSASRTSTTRSRAPQQKLGATLRSRHKDNGEEYIRRTEKALEGASSKRAKAKLLTKLRKKEHEIYGTGPQSRRKRFMDPDTNFGKKSLVYELKQGSLKNLQRGLDEPVRPRPFRDEKPTSRREASFSKPHDGRRDEKDVRDAILNHSSSLEPRGRDWGGSGRATAGSRGRTAGDTIRSRSEPRSQSSRDNDWGMREQRASAPRPDARGRSEPRDRPGAFASRNDSSSTDRPKGRESSDANVHRPAPRPRMGDMMPITIKYTTAASQILYGRSVVKSALDHGRRKLYNLYIYGGENRVETNEVNLIKQLAQKRGVRITIVPQEDQRLMDKMSSGRPHNGFVLETSPLPQLPVASLGQLEDTPGKLGFNVELDRQTKEEEAINGTDTFIPRSNNVTARPLVLLLNEIVDPGNLGAILRSASYLGVDAVGITNRNSSHLTPVVLKSAAGAVEEVTIFTVDSPVSFLEESRKAGWKSYAAVAPPSRKFASLHAGKFVSTQDIERNSPLGEDPCILVLGNEGFGLPKQIKMAADYELSVPRFIQESCVDSLNVSVAAGLLCHAFVREPLVQGVPTEKAQAVAEPQVGHEVKEKQEEAMF